MKLMSERPYSDPEIAARKLIELAMSVEAVQDGRIHIEEINGPFLSKNGCNATGPVVRRGHQVRSRPRLARAARERDLYPSLVAGRQSHAALTTRKFHRNKGRSAG